MDKNFEAFFENKLNTYFLLAPFKKDLLRHYWWVDTKGEVYSLDADTNKKGSFEDIVKLVKEKLIVAKACYGGHGKGFCATNHLVMANISLTRMKLEKKNSLIQ